MCPFQTFLELLPLVKKSSHKLFSWFARDLMPFKAVIIVERFLIPLQTTMSRKIRKMSLIATLKIVKGCWTMTNQFLPSNHVTHLLNRKCAAIFAPPLCFDTITLNNKNSWEDTEEEDEKLVSWKDHWRQRKKKYSSWSTRLLIFAEISSGAMSWTRTRSLLGSIHGVTTHLWTTMRYWMPVWHLRIWNLEICPETSAYSIFSLCYICFLTLTIVFLMRTWSLYWFTADLNGEFPTLIKTSLSFQKCQNKLNHWQNMWVVCYPAAYWRI